MSEWKLPETPDWLLRIVDRLSAVETHLPEPAWLKGELPSWAQHIARELMKTAFPVSKLAVGKVWQPGEIGALLGHQLAYWHWFGEFCETNCNKAGPSWDDLRKVFGPDIEEREKQMAATIADKVLPAFDKALKFALCLASDQNYHESSRFFAAFGRAVLRKPRQGDMFGRTTTMIYWVMLTSWRRVEELGSIHELHRRLCKCIFLSAPVAAKPNNEPLRRSASRELIPNNVVGGFERIEKICERIGLSYKKSEADSNSRAKNSDKGK